MMYFKFYYILLWDIRECICDEKNNYIYFLITLSLSVLKSNDGWKINVYFGVLIFIG
jgi:hypothetical protein